MSVYDLRSLFPYSGAEFKTPSGPWLCRLAEVSDLRPDQDQLSWYLVFEAAPAWSGPRPGFRKLELVTTAEKLTHDGFPPEAESRIASWLEGDEDDARLDWQEISS